MSRFNTFDVVVHKCAGDTPLVVLPVTEQEARHLSEGEVIVRRATNSTNYGTQFFMEKYNEGELEYPLESVTREGKLFKQISALREEMMRSEQGQVLEFAKPN